MIPQRLEHNILHLIFSGIKEERGFNTSFYIKDIYTTAFDRYTDVKRTPHEIMFYWDVNNFQSDFQISENILKTLEAPLLIVTYKLDGFNDWLIDSNCVMELC
jgi:hypothetical protein